jgi:hypothetical protein
MPELGSSSRSVLPLAIARSGGLISDGVSPLIVECPWGSDVADPALRLDSVGNQQSAD